MKIKFIEPIKLIRTIDCYFWRKNLYYDLVEEAKKNFIPAYELLSEPSSAILYSERNLELLDFNKYYDLELTEEELIEYEQTEDIFGVELTNNHLRYVFLALPKRDYYELYDDNLVLIEPKGV